MNDIQEATKKARSQGIRGFERSMPGNIGQAAPDVPGYTPRALNGAERAAGGANTDYLGRGLSPTQSGAQSFAQAQTQTQARGAALRAAPPYVRVASPAVPIPDKGYALGMRAGKAVRAGAGPVGGGVLAGAASLAPYYHAITDDNDMTAGQKLKMGADAFVTGIGGIGGGVAGGAFGSLAGPVGTVAGGVTGGVSGATVASEAGGLVRNGLNWANGQLGGDPNYITSIADDMTKAGYNPNPNVMQMLKGNPKEAGPVKSAATIRAPEVQPKAPEAPTAPNPTPTDADGKFNQYLAEHGAGGVSMSTANGVRTLGNLAANPYATAENMARSEPPVTAEQAVGLRAGRDANEQARQARYAQDAQIVEQQNALARADNERRSLADRTFDTSSADGKIESARAGGRINEMKVLTDAREASIRNFTQDKQIAMQAATSANDTQRAASGGDANKAAALAAYQDKTMAREDARNAIEDKRKDDADSQKYGMGAIKARNEGEKAFEAKVLALAGPSGKVDKSYKPIPNTEASSRMTRMALARVSEMVAQLRASGDNQRADMLEVAGVSGLAQSEVNEIFKQWQYDSAKSKYDSRSLLDGIRGKNPEPAAYQRTGG